MTVKELYKWFWIMYNSCYLIEDKDYSNNFYMYYDEQFLRQQKMSHILDEDIKLPIIPIGKKLFYQNYKNNWLDIDDSIWIVFEDNYSKDYQEVKKLIDIWLKEHKIILKAEKYILEKNQNNPNDIINK